MPAVAELTVRVEVPEPPVILVGLTVATRPADGLVVRATVPVKPLTGEIVIVAVAEAPAFTVKLVVLAVIVKSVMVKVAVAVWDTVPLVPVIVTV